MPLRGRFPYLLEPVAFLCRPEIHLTMLAIKSVL